jgi:CRISPR-associated protein Cmr2
MLLFSLGPVQSFITQARKTRDLWLGSFLLSVLMQESMKGIESKLIFPSKPQIEKNIPDLPNKYIAIFDKRDDAEGAARQSEDNIKTLWGNICQDVWDKVLEELTRSNSITKEQWNVQVAPANVFEFYWVAVEGDEQDYKDWLTETQHMFDQRKHLRDFTQHVETGEKSTISGQRAALRGVGEWREDVRKFWRQVALRQPVRDISQDGSERLDAIDTVKRFALYSDKLARALGYKEFKGGFPSTSSIATASFVEQLLFVSKEDTVKPNLSEWFVVSKALNALMPATIPFLATQAKKHLFGPEILERDGDCYFPETFSANRLKKEFGLDDQRKAERERLAQDGPVAIKRLLQATDKLAQPITHPTPYYAMIQMDGDKMGKLINGISGKKEHQDISRALSTFSRKSVPSLVEDDYPGRLIYAGGDDVFALAPLTRDVARLASMGETLPIETVLNLVDQLQKTYHSVVEQAVIDAPVNDTSPGTTTKTRKELVTASTGIAIAHHYTPLSYVRRVSKEAEQLAKQHYGRNALVVTVLRRSGEQTRVGCHWHYSGLVDEGQPIPLFSAFYDLFVNDVLSPSCVHNLLDEVSTLFFLPIEAQVSEIKRVLLRQRNPALKARFPDEMLKAKAQQLVDLAQAMHEEKLPDDTDGRSVELHAEKRRHGLVEVLGWLLVMLFLARKEQE